MSTSLFEQISDPEALSPKEVGLLAPEAFAEAARRFRAERWARLEAEHRAGSSGAATVAGISDAADTLVRGAAAYALYQTGSPARLAERIAVCAVGGFGRRELNPYSDLDICVFHDGVPGVPLKIFSQYFMPALWDMGASANSSVLALGEALKLAEERVESYTTFSHVRLLWGSRVLLGRFAGQLHAWAQQHRDTINSTLRERLRGTGLRAYQQDLYAVEPHVKLGFGGLRDYHVVRWLMRLDRRADQLEDLAALGILPEDEILRALGARDFLWRVRNSLHFQHRRCHDQLMLGDQTVASSAFNYAGTPHAQVERFMQDYYRAARELRALLVAYLRATDEHPSLPAGPEEGPSLGLTLVRNGRRFLVQEDAHWALEQPRRLLEVFYESASSGVPLSQRVLRSVRANARLAAAHAGSDPLQARLFLSICGHHACAGKVLRQMDESGLLAVLLPEFDAVRGLIRYTDFHHYPVEEHTLRAVAALAEIPAIKGRVGEHLQRVLGNLTRPDLLVLSLLIHDLGKVEGEEHVEAGVPIAEGVCARLALPREDTAMVVALVRQHLRLIHVALYRDTDDLDIILNFSEEIGSLERLRMLLLHSYADLAAVAPGVWTEWKGALLLKLFIRVERVLQGRSAVAVEEEYWRLPKATAVWNQVRARTQEEVQAHLRNFGEQYFLAHTASEIAEHLRLVDEARKTNLALRAKAVGDGRHTELTICCEDRAGLFASLAGSFSAELLDVVQANLFTGEDGWVIDSFIVSDAQSGRALSPAQFNGVRRVMEAVLLEGQSIVLFVERSRARIFGLLQPRVPVRTVISFDNEASRTDTVVDLEAGDRTGLLYDVAAALARHGAVVQSARIFTDARRARDALYIRYQGGKLTDPAAQESVRRALLAAIEPSAHIAATGDRT